MPVSLEIIEVLKYLSPGLIAIIVVVFFTPYKKFPFHFLIIFSLVITYIFEILSYFGRDALFFFGEFLPIGVYRESVAGLFSLIFSIAVGFAIALLINGDHIHRWLRKCGITLDSSLPSVWFDSLRRNKGFATFQLVDGRRLMGWVYEWPTDPKNGFFALKKATWIYENLENEKTDSNSEVEEFLIGAEHVEWIEFIKDLDK